MLYKTIGDRVRKQLQGFQETLTFMFTVTVPWFQPEGRRFQSNYRCYARCVFHPTHSLVNHLRHILAERIETFMFWSLLSFILYTLSSTGYLVFDILAVAISVETFVAYVVYIALAGTFVVESTLHTLDWSHYACSRSKEDYNIREYVLKSIASLFDPVGSITYQLGAIFGVNTTHHQPYFLSSPQIFACNLIGMASLPIEAIISFIGWMLRPWMMPLYTRCCTLDTYSILTGEPLYLAASILSRILAAVYTTTMSHIIIQQNYIGLIQISSIPSSSSCCGFTSEENTSMKNDLVSERRWKAHWQSFFIGILFLWRLIKRSIDSIL